MKPTESEAICLISYEIASILLGGGPDSRPSFWKAYRRELELNQKTDYRNYHVKLCRPLLGHLTTKLKAPVYYRGDRLVFERKFADPATTN